MSDVKRVTSVVAAFIVNPVNGKFLMGLRAGKTSSSTGFWSPIGGHQDYSETPEQSIAREVKEELGLDLPKESFVSMGYGNAFYPELDKHFVIIYFAVPLPKGAVPVITDPPVHSELRWVEIDNLPQPMLAPVTRWLETQSETLRGYIEYTMQEASA
ncbi:MAG: NUDIX domain-containing protein [Bdellovibrionales bacterium]